MKKVKNTKLFIILSFILIGLLVVFGTFIVLYLGIDKDYYEIDDGNVLYSDTLQYIKTTNGARIERKIDGQFYLYQKNANQTESYRLGKSVVVYNPSDSFINLYGNAYQVLNTGGVVYLSKNNKISKNSPTKLIKLDDRKYLMVDSSLVSKNDSVVSTSGYVYIELDKNGNASFSNNEISFKTINPIVLSGTQFDFDIANEKMVIDKTDIDLKNIIGSTNNYKIKESTIIVDSNEEETKDDDNNNGNKGNNGNTSNNEPDIELDIGYYDDYLNSIITSVNNLVVSLKNANDTSSKLISRKEVYYDFNKWVALKKVSSTSTTIDISYSVFDPNSEYDIVFVKLKNGNNEQIYNLNKNNTSFSIGDLKPDTEYNLEFGYKTNSLNENVVEDSVVIATTKADYDLQITKISKNNIIGTNDFKITIFYRLKIDNNYKFKSAVIKLTSNGNEIISETISNDTSGNSVDSISSERIGINGILNGKLVLPVNVQLGSADNENILLLDDIVVCKRDLVDSCIIDADLNIYYKFYND